MREAVSPLERLERALHPWASYVVLPLFALANAGVALDLAGMARRWGSRSRSASSRAWCWASRWGSWPRRVARVSGVAALPPDAGWGQLAGAGLLAGIGFTVSLFIAGLAFPPGELDDAARLGILAASLLAGIAGATLLAVTGRSRRPSQSERTRGSRRGRDTGQDR